MNFDVIWPWSLAAMPAALYLWLYFSYRQVLTDKQDAIEELLDRGAMSQYKKAYGKRGDNSSTHIAKRILFRNNYARSSYLQALVFTMFVTTGATAIAIARAGLPIALPSHLVEFLRTSPAIPAMLAGCAGAFVWGVYELLRRYQIGDLTPSAIYFTGLRLMVLAAVGPAVSIVLKTEFTWPVAFGLGVMPLNILAEVAAEPTRRALKIAIPTTPARDELLAVIQGLTPEMVDRLNEAGIQNVQQLSFTDPLRLLVRTNFDWKVLLDLVDQAFLAVFVGSKITELRLMGIRGAVEFSSTVADPLVTPIATALGRSTDEVDALRTTIREDPTRAFIGDLWLG